MNNLYFIPDLTPGKPHAHTVVGPVPEDQAGNLERWSGWTPKRPIDCPECITELKDFHEQVRLEMIEKYKLPEGWDYNG